MAQIDGLPSYPVVTTLARYGNVIALICGLIPAVAGLIGLGFGLSALWAGLAVFGGGMIWVLVKSYIEVLQILVDALMPR